MRIIDEFSNEDEEEEKQKLFQNCYDLINQGRIPVAAVALSAIDAFALKEFFDFCDMRDREKSRAEGVTKNKWTKAVLDKLYQEAPQANVQREMLKVRIISIPPGAAPDDIKKDWIGVVIPLSVFQPADGEPILVRDIGGKEVSEDRWINGFVVDTVDAIEALDKAGKKRAANWWRKWVELNGVLQTMQLVFSRECGELID